MKYTKRRLSDSTAHVYPRAPAAAWMRWRGGGGRGRRALGRRPELAALGGRVQQVAGLRRVGAGAGHWAWAAAVMLSCIRAAFVHPSRVILHLKF